MSDHLATVLAAGKELGACEHTVARLDELDTRPVLVVPTGVQVLDVERLLEHPSTQRAQVAVREPGSFCDYVLRYLTPATALFASLPELSITAVLDYHDTAQPSEQHGAVAGQARWGQHRAVLTLERTPAWQQWAAIDGKKLGQEAFAEFLDQHLPDIAQPAGADVLEIVRTLEATRAVNFRSAIRLDNGAHHFTYEDTIKATGGPGALDVPSTIVLGLAPFAGAPLYKLEARLRYRLDDGRLSFVVALLRPQVVVEDAFKAVCSLVQDTVAAPLWQAAAPTGIDDPVRVVK